MRKIVALLTVGLAITLVLAPHVSGCGPCYSVCQPAPAFYCFPCSPVVVVVVQPSSGQQTQNGDNNQPTSSNGDNNTTDETPGTPVETPDDDKPGSGTDKPGNDAAFSNGGPALARGASSRPRNSSGYLVIRAPLQAQVTVHGSQVKRTSEEQRFVTPRLRAGETYFYTVKAEVIKQGKPVVVRQRVKVLAGQESVADFSELVPSPASPAEVTVALPSDAQLYIDGVRCPLTSARRTFKTPPLEDGQSYFYTLRAEVDRDGQHYSQRQRVVVEAGKKVSVNLNRLGIESACR